MLEYSKNFLDLLKRDFRRLAIAFGFINVVATIVYPIFAIFTDIGNLYVNISILVLACLYGIFELILGDKRRFKINRIYAWSKVILSTVSLCINIYSIYITAYHVNGVAIVITSVMTIFWILKILINVLYDLLVPRLETFVSCVKEDAKPVANKVDGVRKFFKQETVFDLDKDMSEDVKKVVQKSKKYKDNENKRERKRNINTEYKTIEASADLNNDGIIEIDELIQSGLKVEGVIVNKKDFMHHQFSTVFDRKKVARLTKGNLLFANLKAADLSTYANNIKDEYNDDIKKVKKYIDDGKVDYKNEKDFKKFFKPFSSILQAMQKIIYLYGFEQIESADKLTNFQRTALLNSLTIVLEDNENVGEAKDNLIKLKRYPLTHDLVKKIGSFVTQTNEQFVKEFIPDVLDSEKDDDGSVKKLAHLASKAHDDE